MAGKKKTSKKTSSKKKVVKTEAVKVEDKAIEKTKTFLQMKREYKDQQARDFNKRFASK